MMKMNGNVKIINDTLQMVSFQKVNMLWKPRKETTKC